MKRKCSIVVVFLVMSGLLFSRVTQGVFNTVRNNELDMASFTFEEFLNTTKTHTLYVCIDNTNSHNVNTKDVYKVIEWDEVNLKVILAKDGDEGQTIEITPSNFEEFKATFSGGNCLQTEEGIPIRFLKVKTASKTDDLDIRPTSPTGDVEETLSTADLLYFAYKVRKIGSDVYAYLGTHHKVYLELGPEVKNSEKTLLGWVRISHNGEKENVVLWNTNIGLSPEYDEGAASNAVVFFKDASTAALNYAVNGGHPSEEDLLVNEQGLKTFEEYNLKNNGGNNRWLPMYYSEGRSHSNLVKVGVIEEEGRIRQSLITQITDDKLKVILLVDASISMKPVWEILPRLLIQVMNNIYDASFVNAVGKEIEPQIKIYYYSDTPHNLNSEWIENAAGIEKYRDKIQSIQLVTTHFYLPEISQAIDYVLDSETADPFYMVVIGDAGDHTYPNNSAINFPKVKKRLEEKYVGIGGVLFHSKHSNSEKYENGIHTFRKNFDVKYEITDNTYNTAEIADLAKSITDPVIVDINAVVEKGELIARGKGGAGSVGLAGKNMSIFAQKYLSNMASKLMSLDREGVGTYFEEGIIAINNNTRDAYRKEILIIEEKAIALTSALKEVKVISQTPQFKVMIKQLLASFYEVDYTLVDEEFLENTSLRDLWNIIVGDPVIADQLLPDAFSADISFNYLVNNWTSPGIRDTFVNNAARIQANLIEQIRERRSKWDILILNGDLPMKETYYWVPVDDLMLFRGLDFNLNTR